MQRAEAIGLRYNVADPDRGLQHLARQGDLDRDLPLRRYGIRCRAPAVGAIRQIMSSRFVHAARGCSLAQLVRSPSHSRRAEARATRGATCVVACRPVIGAAIIVLMYALDAWKSARCRQRGTP